MNETVKLALTSALRHGLVLGAGALVTKGILTNDQASQLVDITVAVALIGAAQLWAYAHNTRLGATLDRAVAFADEMFAAAAPTSELIAAVRAPSGAIVPAPGVHTITPISGPASPVAETGKAGTAVAPPVAVVPATPIAPTPSIAVQAPAVGTVVAHGDVA